MATVRLTNAQAILKFLKNQHVHRDSQEIQFFGGVLGIFAHGNVAGIGQAIQESSDFPSILVRNEQSGVQLACGYSKMRNRMQTFACAFSIGPGVTNMVTCTALATINRLSVLLLQGDIFARAKRGDRRDPGICRTRGCTCFRRRRSPGRSAQIMEGTSAEYLSP